MKFIDDEYEYAAKAAPSSEFDSACDRIQKTLYATHEHLSTLEGRLRPALRDFGANATPREAETALKAEPRSPILDRLDDLHREVESLGEMVRALSGRVDL